MDALPALGLILPPDVPPERIVPLARTAEGLGVGEVWLWEDCFAESGVSPAAAVLAATERLRVGLGLMPVPLRAVALTAMEVATLARMFPGRFLPGIGHGVLEWMGQAGVRAASPLTLLREHAEALRALLAGDELSVEGRYVRLDRVQLRWPPAEAPPLLIGGGGPKTLALAGELGDGVILAGDLGDPGAVETTRAAVETVRAARGRRPHRAGGDRAVLAGAGGCVGRRGRAARGRARAGGRDERAAAGARARRPAGDRRRHRAPRPNHRGAAPLSP
ncbi:LLM class flavin-dependent oxidoreductase [Agrococcus lahaulensis]|nr:LLM class flavin-dependent oxidoreductase [Agrococcus lahaulensis]